MAGFSVSHFYFILLIVQIFRYWHFKFNMTFEMLAIWDDLHDMIVLFFYLEPELRMIDDSIVFLPWAMAAMIMMMLRIRWYKMLIWWWCGSPWIRTKESKCHRNQHASLWEHQASRAKEANMHAKMWRGKLGWSVHCRQPVCTHVAICDGLIWYVWLLFGSGWWFLGTLPRRIYDAILHLI